MRPDSSELGTLPPLDPNYETGLKASFFSRKQLESESLGEVQFLIDSCRLVS